MTRRRISEEEARLKQDRFGFDRPKVYKVRVEWTGDQERIEAQAALLGFKDAAEYIFRCAVLGRSVKVSRPGLRARSGLHVQPRARGIRALGSPAGRLIRQVLTQKHPTPPRISLLIRHR